METTQCVDIFHLISENGITPIMVLNDECSTDSIDYAGGDINVMEITFRTFAAAAFYRTITL